MFVRIDTDADQGELCDAENLQQLHVSVPPAADVDAVVRVLEPFGRLDGEHAWLSIDALRDAGPDDEGWRERFDAMIAYAGSKGWTDGRGAVRAHLEREADPDR